MLVQTCLQSPAPFDSLAAAEILELLCELMYLQPTVMLAHLNKIGGPILFVNQLHVVAQEHFRVFIPLLYTDSSFILRVNVSLVVAIVFVYRLM